MTRITLALALLAAPAWAQDLPEADRAALSARVAEFDAAMVAGDMGGLLRFTPPAVRATLAEMSGLSEAELATALAEAAAASMEGASIEDFAMDVDAATPAETPGGERSYVLVPTVTDIAVEAQGLWRSTTQTLAFEDGGDWWLVRVEDPQQVAILAQAYPEFAGVTFPAGTTEPIE